MEDVAIADEQLQDDVKESTVLVCEGADVFILDRSGMQRVLETAIQRSSILSEMQESPGTSTLPVSNDSFVMWLELVDNGADCSNWTQHSDLRDVAQVQSAITAIEDQQWRWMRASRAMADHVCWAAGSGVPEGPSSGDQRHRQAWPAAPRPHDQRQADVRTSAGAPYEARQLHP